MNSGGSTIGYDSNSWGSCLYYFLYARVIVGRTENFFTCTSPTIC